MIRLIRRQALQPHNGACAHLVRASRSGAPTRPTIAAAISGRVRHSPSGDPGPVLALRRNATFRELPGASVTDRETAFGSPDDGSGAEDPGRDHEPSNHGSFGQQARPALRQSSSLSFFRRSIDRLPVSGGDRRFRVTQAVRPWVLPTSVALATCSRRAIRRSSRSAWTTRAAATSSGSRVIVRASQSTYDGSNAATCPSV